MSGRASKCARRASVRASRHRQASARSASRLARWWAAASAQLCITTRMPALARPRWRRSAGGAG
eukprot:scaffold611_cov42-Phaeocystis_antarctica.AAC.2